MNTATHTATSPAPVLPFIPRCDLCFAIGLRINPAGAVEQCPTLQMGFEHCDLLPAGKRIVRSVEMLRRQNKDVDPVLFDIARSLANYSAELPCSSRELIDRHFNYVTGDENQRRLVSHTIKELHDVWFLPVASSKNKPSGYWIARDEQDFRRFVDRAMREPITRLTSLHRLAKANWPVYAEQMEIDFWKDMDHSSSPPYEGGVAAPAATSGADGVVLS